MEKEKLYHIALDDYEHGVVIRSLNDEKRGVRMSNSSVKKLSYNVPLWHKPNLSIEEASIYSNIGTGKLYEMTEKQDCPFVLWIGSRRMIKRKIFEEYIANQYSI